MPSRPSRSEFVREPHPPRLVEVPRPGGGHRLLTVLDRVDGARYAALVARVTGVIERALGPEVLANRVVAGTTTLAPWRGAWHRLLRDHAALAGRGRVLLRTDVRRCYPGITPGQVERALAALGAHTEDTRAIVGLLDRFQVDGVPGLPIGPDPSAVLANAVLAPVDEMLRQEGCPHARWVDDVWAATRDTGHAARALDRLRGALARIGLEVNEEKTDVAPSGDAADAFAGGKASGRGL